MKCNQSRRGFELVSPCQFPARITITPGVYSFDKIPKAELGFKKISRSSEILFSVFFFPLRLLDGVCFQYSQVLVGFLFSECFDTFLFWQYDSFHYSSFSTFHYETRTFFLCQIPFLYPGCIFLLFVSVSKFKIFFCKRLDVFSVY